MAVLSAAQVTQIIGALKKLNANPGEGDEGLLLRTLLNVLGADQTIAPDVDPFIPLYETGVPQAATDAVAANLTTYRTNWTTTTASEGTLADATVVGHLKKIVLTVDVGDLTLTPANFADGTDITFAAVGDYAVLQWAGSDWDVIEIGNEVAGVGAPVVA